MKEIIKAIIEYLIVWGALFVLVAALAGIWGIIDGLLWAKIALTYIILATPLALSWYFN